MATLIPSSKSLCQKLNEMHIKSCFVNFSFRDIKASAQSGCALCCAIHDTVATYVNVTGLTSSSSNMSAYAGTSGVQISCDGTWWELFSEQDDLRKSKTVPLARNISGYTGSDKSFERASQWLKDCLSKHRTLCVWPMHNLKLPNRVLDLSLLTSNGKVVLSERSTDTSLYACLSHCWGKNRPLVTTSETLAQHKLGISYNKLPKTFQDAITFVCRMSIRYLWIDSLCIIQDDEEDWRRESALMADIYRNAVITLAASAATNSTDGLFSSASAKYLGREVKCLKNCADNHGFYVRRGIFHDKRKLALLGRG